jgi:RNA-directed DNA polymerase
MATPVKLSWQSGTESCVVIGNEHHEAEGFGASQNFASSLAHHLTKERVWENLCEIPTNSAPGVDGQTVAEAKDSFGDWIEEMLQSVHRHGYRAPDIWRVYIPKPGKQEQRPLGVPCVADRALQRSVAQVLSAIYEQDFLQCSFGGRPGRGAHHALATLHERIAESKVEWILEADLRNFFGKFKSRLDAPFRRAPG